MKLPLKKIILGLVLLGAFLFNPQAALASTLSLSPGNGNVNVGSITSIQVILNTGGEAVNAVSAYISYPQDKFDIAWITTGSSAFSIEAEQSASNGLIKISRGSITPVNSASANVATIGLKGKAVGSGSLSFTSGSAAPRASDSSDSLNLAGSKGGTYTAIQPATANPSAPAPTQDKTAPVVSEVKSGDVTNSSVTISWKTDEASDSEVEFGYEKDRYIFRVIGSEMVKEHSLKIVNSLLTPVVPGATIYYRVKSKDAAGNIVTAEASTVKVKGLTIRIRATDRFGLPIGGVEIILYSDPKSSKTNLFGEATFTDVTPGKHQVVMKLDKSEQATDIEVAETDGNQSFTVKSDDLSALVGLNPLYLLGSLILVILAVMLIIRRIRQKGVTNNFPNSPTPPSTPAPTILQDPRLPPV